MKSLFAGTKHQRAFGAKIPVRYHPVVVINALAVHVGSPWSISRRAAAPEAASPVS